MIAIVALMMAVSLPPGVTVIANYHDRLLEICENKAGRACCRASVNAMRREQARVYDEAIGCAPRTRPVSLRCPASFTWCSYKSRSEIEGEEWTD